MARANNGAEPKHKLNIRQKKLVDAYLECGNVYIAAERAGYRPSYAHTAFNQPAVQEYYKQRRAAIVPSTEVLRFLIGVMRGDIRDDKLRTKAAYQLGVRACLWRTPEEAKSYLEEKEGDY